MRHVLIGFSAALFSCAQVVAAPTLTLNVVFQMGTATTTTCPSNVTSVEAVESTGYLPPTTAACSTDGGGVSISIDDVAPGTYKIQTVGLDNGTTTWSANQSYVVTATGTNTFTVPLQEVGDTVDFDFQFAAPAGSMTGGMTCADADISNVTIVVDPGSSTSVTTTVACIDVTTMEARGQIGGVSAGTHNFDVSAADSSGTKIWDASIIQQPVSAMGNDFFANMQGQVPGPLGVSLAFPSGTGCPAGVTEIEYQIVNPDGSMGASGTTACGTTNDFTLVPAEGSTLAAGIYSVTLQGCDGTGNCSYTSAGYPTPVGDIFVLPENLPTNLPVVTMSSAS